MSKPFESPEVRERRIDLIALSDNIVRIDMAQS